MASHLIKYTREAAILRNETEFMWIHRLLTQLPMGNNTIDISMIPNQPKKYNSSMNLATSVSQLTNVSVYTTEQTFRTCRTFNGNSLFDPSFFSLIGELEIKHFGYNAPAHFHFTPAHFHEWTDILT